MEMITVTAKTLDEAITKALIQLGTTSDNLEYTVIEKGSAGFLGFIGKKDVVIQAKKKKENDLDDIFSLDEKKIELLQKIAHRLNEAHVQWALGASMLLYFKSITSEFHDIDLMVADHAVFDVRPFKAC